MKKTGKHIQGGHKPQKIKRRMCKMNNVHNKAKEILEVSKQQDNSNEYLLALLIAEIENLTAVIKYKPQYKGSSQFMRNKMMYRHMLDPGLSKELVIDVLKLLRFEGRGSSLLSQSLTMYSENGVSPLTELELYEACIVYLKDPSASIDDIIRCVTRGRFLKDEEKYFNIILSNRNNAHMLIKDINKKINSLERELFSLEQDQKPGVKTIKYEGVRLENHKTSMDHKLISYIQEKEILQNEIKLLKSLINKVKDDRQALNDIIQELDLSTNDAINQEKAKIKQYLYETLK